MKTRLGKRWRLMLALLYLYFPTVQWGYTAITTSQKTTVTFPIAFTSACYTISATTYYPDDISGISNPCGPSSAPTKTNCVFSTNNEYAGFYWIAIGK